jgi:hypothetical protein
MQKKNFLYFLILLCSCSSATDFSTIERGFVTPPDSIRIGAYWYWMNDNMSVEGVTKDLHAMKQAGISKVLLGSNIVSENTESGNVKLFSDEWYEVMHATLKTAGELGIDVALFNCPGWSQSGGPWIKPEQSMRYLAFSETGVKGPATITQQLRKPTADFQDVKTLAFPVSPDYKSNLISIPGTKTVSRDGKISVSALSNNPVKYTLPPGESSIDFVLSEAATIRSIAIYPADNLYMDVELQTKQDADFKPVTGFTVNRSNMATQTGFEPLAPVVVTFPAIRSGEFRLIFGKARGNLKVRDIVLTATPLQERYAEKTLAKMAPGGNPAWDYYLWKQQPETKDVLTVDPHQVRDISENMTADGFLTWEVPPGEWIIMRTGMTSTGVTNTPATPDATGLEVDKMSKTHIKAHFDAFVGQIMKKIPAEDRKALRVVVADSYETGGQNMTDGILEEFQQRFGYDPVPFLPVMHGHVIGSPDLSDRFLWDIRRMVADKIAYDYVGGLREVCHQHGLTTWLENYGHWGFPSEFLLYGSQSDEIGGEFWCSGLGQVETRAASSCAHTYGKNRVWAESFTSGSENAHSRDPFQLKRRGDWSFTEGINSTILTLYIGQDYEDRYPGTDAWFGSEFNRKNTWFSHLDLYTAYLKRCNFMLQQGLNIADAAYFIGEDAPKMTGVRNPALPRGYDFDYINADVIVRNMFVKDGKLMLPHGTSYRLLVLPQLETMRPEVLRKIEQLVYNGAVILGPPPSRSPSMQDYPEADQQIRALSEKMWGDLSVKQRHYGKGMIFTDMTMEEAFAVLGVKPDCLPDNDKVRYNHRSVDGKEIYFLTNQREQPATFQATFRVQGMKPELWDAVTGTIRPLPAFEQKDSITIVPMKLDAAGSTFIVFRDKGNPTANDMAANFPEPKLFTAVNTPWEVRFESDIAKRGPAESVTFTELQDWSQSNDERIRYYSGTAVYTTKIVLDALPNGKTLFLDLGNLHSMAKAKVNGEYAGGAWTFPYRIPVTGLLKQGENIIEVEIVNAWRNRLIGDLQLPEEERIVKTANSRWKADSPLQPAGLIGPVNIVVN